MSVYPVPRNIYTLHNKTNDVTCSASRTFLFIVYRSLVGSRDVNQNTIFPILNMLTRAKRSQVSNNSRYSYLVLLFSLSPPTRLPPPFRTSSREKGNNTNFSLRVKIPRITLNPSPSFQRRREL